MDLPIFDPLSDDLRWCVYCGADCWPEPENQRHKLTCPVVVGVYPVLEQDRLPDGTFGACTACCGQFVLGDLYVHVSDDTGRSVDNPATGATSWLVCLPCGAAGSDPRGDDSAPASQEGGKQ